MFCMEENKQPELIYNNSSKQKNIFEDLFTKYRFV